MTMMKTPREISSLYEVIPVGARYKQLGRPTHFRSGHQNPINEASLMVVEMMVTFETMMKLMMMIVKRMKVIVNTRDHFSEHAVSAMQWQ